MEENDNIEKMLKQEIKKEEIQKAIRSLKSGKSCGGDGIPGEIYKENEK